MDFTKYTKVRNEKFGAVVFDTLNEKVFVTNESGDEILRLTFRLSPSGSVGSTAKSRRKYKPMSKSSPTGSDLRGF